VTALLFVAVLLVFVLVRLPAMGTQLWWGSAEQHHYGLFPHHLVHGLAGNPLEYLPEIHQGCAVIWGAACAPVFAVNGSTRGSLRWCNLLWHVAMLALFGLLAVRLAGTPGLLVLGLLWALPPPSVVDASHFGWVTHIDAGLLTAGVLLCLLRAQDRPEVRAWAVGAGLLAGLSVWFYFDSVLVLAGMGVAAAWTLGRRVVVPGAVGFAIAMAPQFVVGGYWSHPGGLGDGGGEGPGLVARVAELFSVALPRMWGYPGADGPDPPRLNTPGSAGWMYLGGLLLLLGAAAFALRSVDRFAVRAIGLGLGVHLLGCLASGLDLSHGRYVMPIWPWLALAGAVAAGSTFGGQRVRAKTAAAAGLILLAGMGLRYGPATWSPAGPEQRAWADGRAAYVLSGQAFGYDVLIGRGPEALLELAERYPGDRWELATLAGRALIRQEADADVATQTDVPAALRPWFVEGAGREYAERRAKEGPIDLAWAERTWRTSRGGSAAWRRGVLFGSFIRLLDDVPEDRLKIDDADLSPAERDSLCVSYGAWSQPLGWTYEPLRQPDSWCRPEAFAVGVGAGVARTIVPTGRDPGGDPDLAWWVGIEQPPEVVEAFECGWRVERDRLLALAADGWRDPPPHRSAATCLHGALLGRRPSIGGGFGRN